MQELRRFRAAEAHQAVAVDETAFYAVTNRAIAKYDKFSGKRLATWQAEKGSPIRHLNSALVHEGRLLCANSNWPMTPRKNSLEIFDATSLKHLESKAFLGTEGAINWIDRHQDSWWIVFAFYGEEVRKTRLVRYSDQWKVTGQWLFPQTVIKRFRPNSNSGGSFGPNGRLMVTGHDHGELYVLRVPTEGGLLHHDETVVAPIAGQGIAWDRFDIGALYGVVRRTREVVAMQLTNTEEPKALNRSVEWLRDAKNPILPPRSGEFDSTRCMNPWVVRDGDSYRVFYSGGGDDGRQRMGVATAALETVSDVTAWRREGPLFSTGPEGAFDARWCVLPHVVRWDGGWRMYYTGNRGAGAGLAAFPGIGFAVSGDGRKWTRRQGEAVLQPSGERGRPDAIGIAGGSLLLLTGASGETQWQFYYTGCPTIGTSLSLNQQKTICLATSEDGIHWHKEGAVMLRDPRRDYEDIGVAGPVVLRDPDGLFRMWYSAIGTRWGYYCICYAESTDGRHWRRGAKNGDNLQLAPSGNGWERQMVEYPSVIREGNRLRMFYCGNGYGRTGIGTAVSRPSDIPH